jgi:hypothetical protein
MARSQLVTLHLVDQARAYINAKTGTIHLTRYPPTPGFDVTSLCSRPIATFNQATEGFDLRDDVLALETPEGYAAAKAMARDCLTCLKEYPRLMTTVRSWARREAEEARRVAAAGDGFQAILDGVQQVRETIPAGSDDRLRAALLVIEDLVGLHRRDRE